MVGSSSRSRRRGRLSCRGRDRKEKKDDEDDDDDGAEFWRAHPTSIGARQRSSSSCLWYKGEGGVGLWSRRACALQGRDDRSRC